MKYCKTIFILFSILLLISTLTLKIYFRSDDSRYKKEINNFGVSDTVDIYIDEYGAPFIYTSNNQDLFFTVGYITARERLFQLMLLKAVANGEISSILGDNYLSHDNYIKKNKDAKIDLNTIEEEHLELIESYCDGINSYINDRSRSMPISFKITHTKPQEWKAKDAVAVLNLLTKNDLSELNQKAMQGAVLQYFGEARSLNLTNTLPLEDQTNEDNIMQKVKLKYEIMELIGGSGSTIGSEAIIVSPNLTESKKPILIFDDIWGYRLPSKWFEISLTGGDYNVSGAIIPGFPLPLAGRTKDAIFAYTGSIDAEKINSMFTIAKNIQSTIKPDVFADTSGNVQNEQYLEHLNLLNDKLQMADKFDIHDIYNILKETENLQKANELQDILSYYNNIDNNIEINELLSWDGDESHDSKNALLVTTIYKKLIEGIFKDELSLIGDDIYDLFIKNTKVIKKNLTNVLYQQDSAWWDDINTINHQETRTDVIQKAVDEAVSEINSVYGNLYYSWGLVNPPGFFHYLSIRGLLKLFMRFDTGSLERRGSNSGININEFLFDEKLTPISTIVLRKIYDLSDLNTSYSMLAVGQSGNPQSPHYTDQLGLYKNLDLRKIEHNEEAIRTSETLRHIRIYPPK